MVRWVYVYSVNSAARRCICQTFMFIDAVGLENLCKQLMPTFAIPPYLITYSVCNLSRCARPRKQLLTHLCCSTFLLEPVPQLALAFFIRSYCIKVPIEI